MKFCFFSSGEELSERAGELILGAIAEKPDLLLCVATGSSPEGTYQGLAGAYERNPEKFSRLRVIKLDEWAGVAMDNPASCEHQIRKQVLEPLHIGADRYTAFRSDAPDREVECKRIEKALEKEGPIDLCILGLGRNGHLGLNEPGESLQPHPHVAALSQSSRNHPMAAGLETKPEQGLTLGMANLMSARRILLLVSGEGKRDVFYQLLQGKIRTTLPASFLWLHPRVEVLVLQQMKDVFRDYGGTSM
ncbi:MAG: galactosamine-6-phosphate isomerase [Bacteroidales bacterium]